MPHRLPASAATTEARVIFAALKSLARRPLQPVQVEPGWRRFGAMDTSSYGNIVAMLLLLIVVETPATHIILGSLMHPSATRAVLRILLVGSSVYVAVWLLGDLRLLRETPGVLLGQAELLVELGVRVNGSVQLANITHAELLNARLSSSSRDSNTIRITPQPKPNCRVYLRSPVSMRGLFGIARRGAKLDVYVDDPEGLVTAIETRRRRFKG